MSESAFQDHYPEAYAQCYGCGRLNETVERIAQSVLEMQRLERKIRSETAQARKSAVYMAIAPAFICSPRPGGD